MFKNILNDIAGIGIFPTIAFSIFFLFFIGVVIYLVKVDKKHMNDMAELPFDEDDIEDNE